MNIRYDMSKSNPLCEIMERNRSEKGGIDHTRCWHNYTLVYYGMFKDWINRPLRIFELGLGTNNTEIPSNMGVNGRPGASLFGWREFFPNAYIFGADIDEDILFNSKRIRTFYCDQTKPEVIQKMWENPKLEEGFDIIVEDGLHNYEANVCFFENSIHKLKEGGYYIIESVNQETAKKFDKLLIEWKQKYPDLRFRVMRIPSYVNSGDNTLVIAHRPMKIE